MTIQDFLAKVQLIASFRPKYRQPGDGSDGTCDCIGLVIGAIRRMGLKWTGIHGTNWAARKEFVQLKKIKDINDLELGDVVLKAYEKGEPGWNLPGRYQPGKSYYNGDLRDYYHAGVVTGLNPVKITHMTSPTIKVLVTTTLKGLGKWGYYGHLKILAQAGVYGTNTAPVAKPEPEVIPTPTTGKKAIVAAPSGRYVKMRKEPSSKCNMYDEVPIGAEVTLEAPGEVWAKISYGRRKNWYMMAKYLDVK